MSAHRAMARELDRRAQRVYSHAGMICLLAAAAPPLAAWGWGNLLSPLPWVLSVTAGLTALLLVRARIKRRLALVAKDLGRYCEANAISPQALTSYYARQGEYAFLTALTQPAEDPAS